MNSFCAIIPVANLQSARATLDAAGEGPENFAVALYDGVRPGWAGCHVWDTPQTQACIAAIKALPGVLWNDGDAALRATRFTTLCDGQSAAWGKDAPALRGQVTPGLHRDPETNDLWWVIQPFDRNTYNAALSTYPALVRQARIPGVVTEWVQPNDQHDAYLVTNPFTGSGDMVTHNGSLWLCSDGSAGSVSKVNTWPPDGPGAFGWTDLGPV